MSLNPSGLCQCGCEQPAPLAAQSSTARGYIKGEPLRYLPHHHERARKAVPVQERFWDKVDRRGPDECWEWTAGRFKAGYGGIRAAGKRDTLYAHRVSYEIAYGPLDDGVHVIHTCDNPPCVNPAHLRAGDRDANMADMVAKGRARGARGSSHHSAVLTEAQVRHIRQTYTGARGEQVAFARRYGVTKAAIEGVVNRRTWRHI